MRILRVAQKIYPDVKGGGPYHVHALSRDQAAMGHDVTVVTVGAGPRREERAGYHLVRCPAWASLLQNDIAPSVWEELGEAEEHDIVHAHSHLYFSTNLAALHRRLSDTPLALTNHGLYSQTAPKWMFAAYLRTLGRFTFNSADTIFCYTTVDRRRLRHIGVSSQISVVPNGIDTDRFTPEGDRHPAIDDDGEIILFVGRLVEGKRPVDAVAAVKTLRELRADARLVLCGDGPQAHVVRDRAEDLGIREAVTFLGTVPYDEMPTVYRAADALVLPSRAEGLPRTVLEALACRVPVVASALAQIEPVLEGVGKTVAVGDIDGFAHALDEVLTGTPGDPRAAVTGKYAWKTTIQKTTTLLTQLAKDTNVEP